MKSRFLLIALSLLMASCGGRIPSPQRAQHILSKHFNKYGKKYKESDFGKNRVEKVEISSITEVQKNLASVEAFTYLSGEGLYKVNALLEKKSLGWRLVSWESLANR